MKTYEVIHEIFNQCPGNHSRDNFIQELEMESPEVWLHAKFKSEKELRMEKTEKEDGSVVYDVYTAIMPRRLKGRETIAFFSGFDIIEKARGGNHNGRDETCPYTQSS